MPNMPDISELLYDPDVGGGQEFKVERTIQTRDKGRLVSQPTVVTDAIGNVQPAQPDELEQFPEEDQKNSVMAFRSTFQFQLGSDDGITSVSPDVISYQDKKYRLLKIDDWSVYGWQCAFATLI